MKRSLLSLLAFGALCSPLSAFADPINLDEHNSYHSLGCMILRECTDDVTRIKNLADIKEVMPDADFDWMEEEIDQILFAMDKIGIEVYIAEDKYFPPNHRGVYTPDGNRMFLNMDWMKEPHYLLRVLRHEGWHAAQDCMAGTIDNSHVAVILQDGKVPWFWHETASRTYPPNVVPWEQEAMYAATQNDMTSFALLACGREDKPMWETYEPTPLTREWLVNEGYMKDE